MSSTCILPLLCVLLLAPWSDIILPRCHQTVDGNAGTVSGLTNWICVFQATRMNHHGGSSRLAAAQGLAVSDDNLGASEGSGFELFSQFESVLQLSGDFTGGRGVRGRRTTRRAVYGNPDTLRKQQLELYHVAGMYGMLHCLMRALAWHSNCPEWYPTSQCILVYLSQHLCLPHHKCGCYTSRCCSYDMPRSIRRSTICKFHKYNPFVLTTGSPMVYHSFNTSQSPGGKNYLPRVRDQGDCATCVAHAVAAAATASVASALREDATNWDINPQSLYYCSEGGRTCNSGWQIDAALFEVSSSVAWTANLNLEIRS